MKPENMESDYDMSNGKRGQIISRPDKTRITIWIDNDILESYRLNAERSGKGYQTLINETLRKAISRQSQPVTEEILRKILKEELMHR